jgi:[ribosomal protein S5]-alanine N-acetyltransferase
MTLPRRDDTPMALHPAHPAQPAGGGLRLYGKRIMLRPLGPPDFPAWSSVRLQNEDWLLMWEPRRLPAAPDPARDRSAFASRCTTRDRERLNGQSYAFGLFTAGLLIGEVNLNNINRGPLQCGTIGYWIARQHAGKGYVPEGVVVLLRFAFEELRLHRLEICIVPRNTPSRRVVEKLQIRDEGTATRYLEIDGVWEDHVRFGITAEEWAERAADFSRNWLV